VRTDAALRIAKGLGLPWSLFAAFLVVPAFLRDPLYRLIARYRYRWFGKRETCMVPTKELRARFLDWGEPKD
jgi:predicted DCC family thiol-disulfide oxidoreductase YuxK